jgi:hypothetical protein
MDYFNTVATKGDTLKLLKGASCFNCRFYGKFWILHKENPAINKCFKEAIVNSNFSMLNWAVERSSIDYCSHWEEATSYNRGLR